MAQFCLDANVFIEAKNGPYGLDIWPVFWNFLDQKFQSGVISSSSMVYDELIEGSDELADWVRLRKEYFIKPTFDVQSVYRKIADFIQNNVHYPLHQKSLFLSNADVWVIAQAKVLDQIVVTSEKLVDENSRKIKIPNICREFNVQYESLYQMLRDLKAKF